MSDFPARYELEELQAYSEPHCVSAYLPAINPEDITNPNRIELKNLLKQVKVALLDTDITPRDLRKTLRPAQELTKDTTFWSQHRESLALFMHARFFRYYHIPDHTTPYQLTVERGFNLEPLLSAMHDNQSYFVLVLSHKHVQLYEGDHFHLRPVHLRNFPTNMDEALGYDENPKWRETHTIAPAATGKGSEAYHGQYNVAQVDKLMLEEFFRAIDRRLHRYLIARRKPLILAGVRYLLPIYRRINTYDYLLSECIQGGVKDKQPRVIRTRAWAIISKESGTLKQAAQHRRI